MIVEELCKALNPTGDRYVLPFVSRRSRRADEPSPDLYQQAFSRVPHNERRDGQRSSKQEQEVAAFEYSPADKKYPLLFEMSRPLDELRETLLKDCAGKRMPFKQLYEVTAS